MFFRLFYLHGYDAKLTEYEILSCVCSFAGSKRTFVEGYSWKGNERWPMTTYYIEAPAECGTILTLKGFWINTLDEEPPELKDLSRVHVTKIHS